MTKNPGYHGNIPLLRWLQNRKSEICNRDYRRVLLDREFVEKLDVERDILNNPDSGSRQLTTLRWGGGGAYLVTCGDTLHLHSYPSYQPLGGTTLPGTVFNAELMTGGRVLAGDWAGAVFLLPLARLRECHDPSEPESLSDWKRLSCDVLKCNSGAVFSVKPLDDHVFMTASSDRTVRLQDARQLCTCTGERVCENNVMLGGRSFKALDVNPTNPYQFCVSHGNFLGVHDLRMCCEDQDSLLLRYDIPPLPHRRSHNRINHATFSECGSEILINTRSVGLLLVSTRADGVSRDHGNTSRDHGNASRDHGNASRDHGNASRDHDVTTRGGCPRVVISEDSPSDRLVPNSEPLGLFLNQQLTRTAQDYYSSSSRERESERESRGIVARYTGHKNTRTELMEASFWDDQFVVSGSDCGHVFIWDKTTSSILTVLPTALRPPISVRPHPVDPVLAGTGLRGEGVRIWQPNFQKSPVSRSTIDRLLLENTRRVQEEYNVISIPNSVIMRATSFEDPGGYLNTLL